MSLPAAQEKAPRRPLVRYHGGKWRLAPWIISHFPEHRTYVEPFGGGGSVLLRKPRSYAEVYNDLDGEIVNLFRVVRDQGEAFVKAIRLTPFAREEFVQAYEPTPDCFEQARRTMVRSGMGFGSSGTSSLIKTGFRGSATRSGTHPGSDWRNQPLNLEDVVERLRGVIIENTAAVKVMAYHDSPQTLHYVDPPYVQSLRTWCKPGSKEAYRHEMTDADHVDLLRFLKTLKGMVVVSGYRCDIYDQELDGWTRIDKSAMADKAMPRVESLWLNFTPQQSLFKEVPA